MTKAERFAKAQGGAMRDVLYALETLTALSDRRKYEYTSQQITAMFEDIDDWIDAAVAAFSSGHGDASAPADPSPVKPVAAEMSALDTLSTQQLVDRMIACGAELARRRK